VSLYILVLVQFKIYVADSARFLGGFFMSMDVVRHRAKLPSSMQIAPTVVVSSGGDFSKKHLGSGSRLQPLASDTLELSKKRHQSTPTAPSLLQRLGQAFKAK
jgi:hypothetical protein